MISVTAHFLYTGKGSPIKYGIVQLNEEGIIEQVIDPGGILRESANTRFYNGILTPGFLNFLGAPSLKQVFPPNIDPTIFRNFASLNPITEGVVHDDQQEILEAMKAFREYGYDLGSMIFWATWLSAVEAGLQDQLGSIEPGKEPGINHIEGVNLENMHLEEPSVVKVLF